MLIPMPEPRTSWHGAGSSRRPRSRRSRRSFSALGILVGAAFVGALIGVAPAMNGAQAPIPYAEPISGCRVTDGDTIRCGGERIRLLGIDAPELPGHCRKGRVCAPGDPHASTASLDQALSGSLTIERVGTDRYGRTLALVASARGDLSCWQLARRQAIYKAAWDDGLRIARSCPEAALAR